MGTTSSPLGWLVVGHGTRDPAGRAEFFELVALLTQRAAVAHPNAIVEPAFLELAEPTIDAGLARLAERGVQKVLVVPLLLFTAGHAKDDIPQAVAAAADPLGIEVVGQSAALAAHPKLLELSRQRFYEAVGDDADLAETVLLMIGRGGSDESANAMMRTYALELAAGLSVRGETAFVAIASPSIADALDKLGAERPRRVVVQPHLLFRGEVLSTIATRLQAAVQVHPAIEWRMAAHFGPHELVAEALLTRIAESSVI